jgi:small ubiquitin-related modifier
MSTPPAQPPTEDSATVKPEGEDKSPEHINIKVTDSTTEVFFRIKRTTPLRKAIDVFCKRTGKDAKSLRFLYDGERVSENDTPASVCTPQTIRNWQWHEPTGNKLLKCKSTRWMAVIIYEY